jgi:hypothetical protein
MHICKASFCGTPIAQSSTTVAIIMQNLSYVKNGEQALKWVEEAGGSGRA